MHTVLVDLYCGSSITISWTGGIRSRFNGAFSTGTTTVLGVPQGSVLGSLFVNIYLEETEICIYAKETEPNNLMNG